MKILLINNFYYNRGGDCTYLFSLKNLLEEKGHKVVVFSMNHPQNFDNEYSEYFVSYINYDEEMHNISIPSGVKVLDRTVFSREAKRKIEALVEKERPDIAHLQNIHHHITPSILYTFKKYKIPIIWTLHDYSIICPNTSFLSNGKICERCKKLKYYWPPVVRCKKDSLSASMVAAIETTMHRILKINAMVDFFIAPSEFLRRKFIEYGFEERKIRRSSYFIEPDSSAGQDMGDYYLYVGRISEEKGVKTLIDAAVKTLSSSYFSVFPGVKASKLKIVGSGPLLDEMVSYAKAKNGDKFIEFLGHRNHKEVIELMKGSRFVVVPSEWYENFPFAVLEAFSCGKPAIGSKLGGIPELIRDTERGIIFEPGNSDDLSAAIRFLINNPDICTEMGRNAMAFVKSEVTPKKHYEELIEIYSQAISKKDSQSPVSR